MPDIETKYVDLSVNDGSTMRAWQALPMAASPKAGLIVFQEAFGVNAHIRDVAERFARQGYAAIAPEMFHRTGPGFEGSYGAFGEAKPHIDQLTPQGIDADIRAAHSFLTSIAPSRIAAVGYCLGGTVAFLASATVLLKAAVSYYGGRIAPSIARAAQLSSPMLFIWGGRDEHIGPEVRQTVEQGMQASLHPSIQVTFSDADHGFFCDRRSSYNPRAAQLAWNVTLSFLDHHLGTR